MMLLFGEYKEMAHARCHLLKTCRDETTFTLKWLIGGE